MDEFVANQNIARFRQRLEDGVDQTTRTVLLRLLLQEEDMFGRTRAQLHRVDRHIARLRQAIRNTEDQEDATERYQVLLATLNDLLATYELQRKRISAALVGES